MRRTAFFVTLTLVACTREPSTTPPPTDQAVLSPTRDTTMAGEYTFDRVRIARGVTVHASSDLSISSRNSIEIEGQLRSDRATIRLHARGSLGVSGVVTNAQSKPTSNAPDLILIGEGGIAIDSARVECSGSIWIVSDSTLLVPAGDPRPSTGDRRAAAGTVHEAPGRTDATVQLHTSIVRVFPSAATGARGGSVVLSSLGELLLGKEVRLSAQDGGAGGSIAVSHADSVVAGRGGEGGWIVLEAAGVIVLDEAVVLEVGSGGHGGDALVSGPPTQTPEPSAAVGGRGGDTGRLEVVTFERMEMRGACRLMHGDAGHGGDADARGADALPIPASTQGRGGRAFARGGNGGKALDAHWPRKIVNPNFLEVSGGRGGGGGQAIAVGGIGARSPVAGADGGAGGDITAHGGNGGSSYVRNGYLDFVGTGGEAGGAELRAGTGAPGYDQPCDLAPARGGWGGRAGDGTAIEGERGSGHEPGARSIVRLVSAGNGGNGGAGNPGGYPGAGGSPTIVVHGQLIDEGTNFTRGSFGPWCDSMFGACCSDSGTCVLTDELSCAATGGTFVGVGTTCESAGCGTADGACCIRGEWCEVTSPEACIYDYGGEFLGPYTECETADCPAGACCLDDGSCLQLGPFNCGQILGAEFFGEHTECKPLPCFLGACCQSDGTICVVMSQDRCGESGGVFQGAGVPCTPSPCPGLGGACCLPTACVYTTDWQCRERSGLFQGEGTVCQPNPCR